MRRLLRVIVTAAAAVAVLAPSPTFAASGIAPPPTTPATTTPVATTPVIIAAPTPGAPPTSAPASGDDQEDDAAPERSGPRITLDRTEVRKGEPVIVTMTNFTSQQATVSVCGNLAKRGSEDCNMPTAQSERIRPDEPETLTQLFVEEPPAACPCIVRALGTNGEFAIAPIDLVDHPVAPIVSPELGPLVEVDLEAERVETNLSGRIRTGLGAATAHALTVSVRNITTETLGDVVVRARVSSRLGDDIVPVVFDVPGPIEPGQTWTQTIEVELPAPFLGTFTWRASASGAGPTVDATTTTHAVPAILYTFLVILVLDILVLIVRAIMRSRRRAGRGRRGRRRTATRTEVPLDDVVVDADREPVGVG